MPNTYHNHFNDSPANIARCNFAAGAIPGANMRQPNNALPMATMRPPANPDRAASAPSNAQNNAATTAAQPICKDTTRSTSRVAVPTLFMSAKRVHRKGVRRVTGLRQSLSNVVLTHLFIGNAAA